MAVSKAQAQPLLLHDHMHVADTFNTCSLDSLLPQGTSSKGVSQLKDSAVEFEREEFRALTVEYSSQPVLGSY